MINRNSKGQFISGVGGEKKTQFGFGNTFYKLRKTEFMQGKSHSSETRRKISEARKGKRSNNWQGGLTKKNKLLRGLNNYDLWRKSCLQRDNFTCQKTGISGGEMVVHHINNFVEFPEFRYAIDNGITLLKSVHLEFHKRYGFKHNTKEQLEEFLKS